MSKSHRRKLLLASSALLVVSYVNAQPVAKNARLGVLLISTEHAAYLTTQAFLAGLRDYGYVVGLNVVVDIRYSNGDQNQLQSLADELLALKPDVLVGTQITASVMKAKTSTVPIVLLTSADPVSGGLVNSLARPGTNVTGMSGQMYDLVGKQVELLAELVPKLSVVALLTGFNATEYLDSRVKIRGTPL